MTKRNMFSEIMKKAWVLFRKLMTNFSEALKQAWKWFKLKRKLQNNTKVEFTFIKADKSIRKAKGTLMGNVITEKIKNIKNNNYPHLQVFFDTEINEFRSFHIINLL